ncbi:nitrate ABC transporter ATP-binding protein [Candidatus Bathyarchaeota archaeon]|nr:MAG: nitrate ABC transporter ATP-binding protein [Candidatus Bathyarchaeota archaeon]
MFLEVQNVTKIFRSSEKKSIVAIKDLSLQVSKGELLCILGPIGCGKSTLLNMIAGFEKPTSGRILLEGREIEGPGPDRVMVFQEETLFPWMTILDNIMFGLRLKGLSDEESRREAQRHLSLVGLEKFSAFRPHELSGGMKRKAELARALAIDPKILLMDEPLSSIDAISRAGLLREILRVWERSGKTIIYVTHNIDEALYLADRIIVLTARPARVKSEIQVDEPRPRDLLSNAMIALKRNLLKELAQSHVLAE